MSDCSGGRGFRGGLPHLPHLTVRAQQLRQFWAECHCGHTGNRIQKKQDDKVGAPSPCHPLRAATHRQSLFMPLRPFLMPSSAQRAQGIVKNVNPLSTKKLGAMSGGMKYIPGTTLCCLQAAAILSKPA